MLEIDTGIAAGGEVPVGLGMAEIAIVFPGGERLGCSDDIYVAKAHRSGVNYDFPPRIEPEALFPPPTYNRVAP